MRILHLSALPVWPIAGKGGMPSLEQTLLGHVRAGHDVVLILPEYHLFSEAPEIIQPPAHAPYQVHIAPCPWMPAILALRAMGRRLGNRKELPFAIRWVLNAVTCVLLTVSLIMEAMRVRRGRRRRFDLVYAHNQYAAMAGLIVAKMLGVPNVTRLYGTFLADLMKKPLVWLRYPVAAAGYLVPHDLLICCNDGTRGDEVARKLRIDQSRFRFWQNGVDLPAEKPSLTRADLLRLFPASGLRPNSSWVLSCSRLSYWKRIDRILHAVRFARDRGCDCQLVVAGDGPERERIRALAAELQLEADVAWLGGVSHDDIWALMNVCDVFMITNDVSNRANPLYEAICAGVSIVTVRDPSTADLVEHEVNGMLADRDNTHELGECLRKVLTDSELACRLRKAQLQKSAGLWSWRERMETEVRELERLVAGRSGRHDGPANSMSKENR
jgi:glycosyltransferase involved in cell wall biosynthesis